jgi:hypothetical protein
MWGSEQTAGRDILEKMDGKTRTWPGLKTRGSGFIGNESILCNDGSFWAGDGCRGRFDFTLLFEESILSILPGVILIIAAAARVVWLFRRRKVNAQDRVWGLIKLVSICFFPTRDPKEHYG